MSYFIGLNLPEDIKLKIAEFQKQIKSPYLIGNWVAKDNFHITIKYLGNIKQNELELIEQYLDKLVLSLKNFDLEIAELEVMPDLKKPSLLWLKVYAKTILEIAENINNFLALDFVKSDFKAHLTLARIKRGKITNDWFLEKQKLLNKIKVKINKISIYESVNKNNSPVYKVLKHFRFKG